MGPRLKNECPEGQQGGCAVRVNVTGGSSGGGEEGSNRIEGDNKGVVAGGGRLRAEGGNRSKGRSAGGRVIQGLVLLMLCTLGGADTGGKWKGLTPVRGRERCLEDNRGGEC